jgi:hypothetical protein
MEQAYLKSLGLLHWNLPEQGKRPGNLKVCFDWSGHCDEWLVLTASTYRMMHDQ